MPIVRRNVLLPDIFEPVIRWIEPSPARSTSFAIRFFVEQERMAEVSGLENGCCAVLLTG